MGLQLAEKHLCCDLWLKQVTDPVLIQGEGTTEGLVWFTRGQNYRTFQCLFIHSSPATPASASVLLLRCAVHTPAPASGPLHLLFPCPWIPFPKHIQGSGCLFSLSFNATLIRRSYPTCLMGNSAFLLHITCLLSPLWFRFCTFHLLEYLSPTYCLIFPCPPLRI